MSIFSTGTVLNGAAGVETAAYKIDRIADMMRVTRALGRIAGDSAINFGAPPRRS